MPSSSPMSCVCSTSGLHLHWWSQTGQKHKTGQQEKPGNFLEMLTSPPLTKQEASVWQILETAELILYNFGSWFFRRQGFFQCYYPKFEILYKTIPFVRLALIVKHSYFRSGKQSFWYRTLKNNAIHLTTLAMVLKLQLLASPTAERAKHIFSTKGKRTN